jgi:5-methylcytosine-specific restriction endonuclease McrBC regulatory subunit McrC
MRIIVAHESREVPLPPELARTDLKQRLLRMSEESPIEIFRRSRKGALLATAVVGTVTCGAVRIEIRPKTSSDNAEHDRDFLINLLRFVGHLKKYHAGVGRVNETDGDPIEVMASEIARDMLDSLRKGIPRRYEMRDTESTTIRGRIDFGRLSTKLPGEQMRVPIRHAELTINNGLSRIIKWVAKVLLGLTRSVRAERQLTEILTALRSVELAGFSQSELDAFTLSRSETRWERTLTIARLLSQGRSINPTTVGFLSGVALVFKLHNLFEQSLRRLLPAALPGGDISVTKKSKEELFMLHSTKRNESLVQLHPDFVYRKGKVPIAIADAKWKLLKEDARGYGVDREDLYQAHAYMSRYQVRDAVLLFPRTGWMPVGWSDSYQIPDTNFNVHLVGIDIESLVSPEQMVSARACESLSRTMARFIPTQNEPVAICG